MEDRRQQALQRKAEEERAKALAEEKRLKEEAERRKRERDETTEKRLPMVKKKVLFKSFTPKSNDTEPSVGRRTCQEAQAQHRGWEGIVNVQAGGCQGKSSFSTAKLGFVVQAA
jgi:hypothetical protein